MCVLDVSQMGLRDDKDLEFANKVIGTLFMEHFGDRILGCLANGYYPKNALGESEVESRNITYGVDSTYCKQPPQISDGVALSHLLIVLGKVKSNIEGYTEGGGFFVRKWPTVYFRDSTKAVIVARVAFFKNKGE